MYSIRIPHKTTRCVQMRDCMCIKRTRSATDLQESSIYFFPIIFHFFLSVLLILHPQMNLWSGYKEKKRGKKELVSADLCCVPTSSAELLLCSVPLTLTALNTFFCWNLRVILWNERVKYEYYWKTVKFWVHTHPFQHEHSGYMPSKKQGFYKVNCLYVIM